MDRQFFVGNWKMNKLASEAQAFAEEFLLYYQPTVDGLPDTGIAPPYTCFVALRTALERQPQILSGFQNLHWLDNGAHTGEISSPMAIELGASFVILGHSERRQHYGETSERVSLRADSATDHGLKAIVCIGEELEDFKQKRTESVIQKQLIESLQAVSAARADRLLIAYEPVWAIGTGLAATPDIAGNIHNLIRRLLQERFGEVAGKDVPILYGGSVNPDNITELVRQPNINGALVGGASLVPKTFWELIDKGRKAIN